MAKYNCIRMYSPFRNADTRETLIMIKLINSGIMENILNLIRQCWATNGTTVRPTYFQSALNLVLSKHKKAPCLDPLAVFETKK